MYQELDLAIDESLKREYIVRCWSCCSCYWSRGCRGYHSCCPEFEYNQPGAFSEQNITGREKNGWTIKGEILGLRWSWRWNHNCWGWDVKIAATERSRLGPKSFASEKNSVQLTDERSLFYLRVIQLLVWSPNCWAVVQPWAESSCMLRQTKQEQKTS